MLDPKTISNHLVTRKEIEDTISEIYLGWQDVKLEILGYTWLLWDGTRPTTQRSMALAFHYDEILVTVNPNRQGEWSFPTVWLSDPNWKDRARKCVEFERDRMLIERLSE